MSDLVLTAEACGIMAQVLAVLMLATAFDPAFRGSVGTKEIVERGTGRVYRVPIKWGRYRLAMLGLALFVILVDTQLLMLGVDVAGVWRVVVVGLNSLPIGAMAASMFLSMHEHAKQPAEDKTNEGRE